MEHVQKLGEHVTEHVTVHVEHVAARFLRDSGAEGSWGQEAMMRSRKGVGRQTP